MGRGRICRVIVGENGARENLTGYSRGEWGEGGSEELVGENGAREDLTG